MKISGLYAILDLPGRHSLAPATVLNALILGGASVIQLRSKHAPLEPELVAALGRQCMAAGVPMILNDELELAERRIPGVAGVHLGQGDLSRLGLPSEGRSDRRSSLRAAGLCLGISTHDLRQLRVAIDELAPDYVGFGPVFSTASKPDHDPVVGLEALARACVLSQVPVVAIGGVNLDNAKALSRCGAASIASIGAVAGPSAAVIRERTFALSRAFAGVLNSQ
ncbi:Thiamin-phosphate pyrophosphorylase [Enhygromyxa salina]|uniref:Thiamin-phosphate pyrophosphorylase n=1 Tax=Enhygromyxa salina TaxID=215803 RepID=A0A0C2D342_9BACT|nr:thiamine phosphate synthase [Enhygromyxa salina]KIG14552.1 Thiamin-phosphate pyrophosphorylase [Enhygromyxa salina]